MIQAFPGVRQQDDFDCGPAAVKSVLGYYGMDSFTLAKYATMLNTSQTDGTDPRSIETLLRQRFRLSVVSGDFEVLDLEHFSRQQVPVICLVTRETAGHYVVVLGVRRGKVHMFDPEDGSLSMTATEFDDCWHDCDRYGLQFKNFGIAARA